MMRQYELVEKVKHYAPDADEDRLNRAYVFAMQAHGNQKRASGAPYFTHPLEVAGILTDLRADDITIVAAILHDTIEDTGTTREDIERLFGDQIAQLVDGLTKLNKLDLVSKKAAQAENLRKLLLAVAQDVRVLLVKLADRLHNMRTLGHVPPEKRARIAEETLEIYAPLAGRIGMQDMREELEDIAFCVLMPEAYAMVQKRLADLRARAGGAIETITGDVKARLQAHGLAGEIKGREKRPYSIWRKMERKALSFEQLSDIYAFRVIVADEAACYQALGVIHQAWRFVPGRFKDYISTPKQNDYRSLHTTVIGPKHQRVELQIRTSRMDEIAEFGIAAHAAYKDLTKDGEKGAASGPYAWLRRTIEVLVTGDNPEEFWEHTKLELFQDQVFCFTPKGFLIALPRGAIPLDFAYAVHTGVGDNAVGCRINGQSASLIGELHNGDEVEILVTEGQTPPLTWEGLVKTGRARGAIRKATREAARKHFLDLGRKVLDRTFASAGKTYSEEKVLAALPRFARKTLEDLWVSLGEGQIESKDVLRALFPDHREEAPKPAPEPGKGWFGLSGAERLKFRVPGQDGLDALPIRGQAKNEAVRFNPHGGALPGDRIVGILTPGEGITIYPIQSRALIAFDDSPERWLDVRWEVDEHNRQRFGARIRACVINEPGVLAAFARVIADNDANIFHMDMRPLTADLHEMVIDLEVWNLKHLNAILSELRVQPTVTSLERVIDA